MLKFARSYYEVGREYKVLKVTKSFKEAKQFRIRFCFKKHLPLSAVYIDLIRKSRDHNWVCYQSVQRFKTAKSVVKAFGE